MNKMVLVALVFISTALMGSSFAIGKIGLSYISPLLLVGLRFVLAGALMAIAVALTKRPHPKYAGNWLKILWIGLFQTTGVFAAVFISMRTITAGESSILTFMNPLLVIIFGSLLLGIKYHFAQWIGVVLGFVGVFIALGGQLHLQFGTILGFAGAVSWTMATFLIKRWGGVIDTWVLSAYQMLFGGIVLLLLSPFLEDPQFIFNSTSLLVLLWLAVIASVVQFTIWFFLLQQGNAAKISSFLFLVPLFGVLTGWLLLDEPFGPALIIGGVLIFTGIFLVNWPKEKKSETPLYAKRSAGR